MLEAISLAPSEISAAELLETFEHLPPFSEIQVKKLIKLCRSKRVLRIFGFLCERTNRTFKDLTYERILKLSGNSAIYVNAKEPSKFSRYWKLMVPVAWIGNAELPFLFSALAEA